MSNCDLAHAFAPVRHGGVAVTLVSSRQLASAGWGTDLKNVEDIYPLSPMQQMMLLHASTHARQDVLFNQVCFRLDGELNEQALVAAWQQLLPRHPALRTLFLAEGLPRPMQVVRQEIQLPFSRLDWREHTAAEQAQLLERLRAEDRDSSFATDQAPLMRLTLARVADQRYYLLWSTHHLVLDRWCTPIILREVAAMYRAAIDGYPATLSPARSFRDYIRWVESRDAEKTGIFWRQLLAGYQGQGRLARRVNGSGTERAVTRIESADWTCLRDACRSRGLTMASLVQGAWALLMNRRCETQDVVFGVVSSGRPAELAEVESIVGSFITNLPVRAQLPADVSLSEWLAGLQQQSRQRLAHEYVSLAQIRSWCDLPPSLMLFDSIIVWLADTGEVDLPGLQTEVISHGMGTAYPMTLYVEEREDSLELSLEIAAGSRAVAPAAELLSQFCSVLLDVSGSDDHARLESLAGFCGARTAVELQSEAVPDRPGPRTVPVAEAGAEVTPGRERPQLQLLEELVSAQWCAVLGVEQLPPGVDFFGAGGDSLQAVSLAESLQIALRKDIPVLSLFREPTVAGMARLILDQDWPTVARVATAIKDQGALSPLFCVASPEVDTVGYAILARHIAPERPVYVLQSPPAEHSVRRMRPPEIPVLAQTYIDGMREIQPRGPYNLMGMCGGSQVAIEICRQLESLGDTVAFAGILDTWALYTLSRRFYFKRALDLARYYAWRVRRLAGRRRDRHTGGEKGRADFAAGGGQGAAGSGGKAAAATGSYSVIEEVGWPWQQPDEPKIASKVTVFRQRHRQQYWRIRDPLLGWARHARTVELVHLKAPGHKHIFREPWVRELARDLDARLAADQG